MTIGQQYSSTVVQQDSSAARQQDSKTKGKQNGMTALQQYSSTARQQYSKTIGQQDKRKAKQQDSRTAVQQYSETVGQQDSTDLVHNNHQAHMHKVCKTTNVHVHHAQLMVRVDILLGSKYRIDKFQHDIINRRVVNIYKTLHGLKVLHLCQSICLTKSALCTLGLTQIVQKVTERSLNFISEQNLANPRNI